MKKLLFLSLVLILISDLSYSQKAYGSELSATVAIPTGPSSEYYNTGYGAIGGFYYEMESNWRLGLTLGFIRFGVNSTEVNNYFQTLNQPGKIDLDGSVSTIPILFSGKYIFPSSSSTKFYGILEAGLYVYWTKSKGNIIYDSSPNEPLPFDESEFTSEVGFDLGFGALFPVSDEISIDASVRYHVVRNSGTIKIKYDNNYYDSYGGEEAVGTSHFINIAIGANWNFSL